MWIRPIVWSKCSAQSGKRVSLRLGAWRHDLAHQTPAHLESVGDNLLTDPGDLGRFHAFIEDQPQFFLAVGQLPFGNRLEVKHAFEQPISEPIEQPNGVSSAACCSTPS
jgi:hypothetical protein